MARVAATPFRVPGIVDSAALERHVVARFEHLPLARFFFSRTRERDFSDRLARAIVKEAGYLQVEPSLLAGVLLTENAPLDVRARSSQGALGLMQVMHFHAGEYDCDSADLLQVESNICHGARVLGYYLKRTGNLRRALLRYNGCVSGTHTPNCRRYPSKVLRTASQVRREVLKYPPYSLAVDTTTF
jgi:soluble lytic murein transglycosylase-like protein